MKIVIISQSPLWTTGFGVTCNKIAFSLANAGHHVTCFSLGEDSNEKQEHPFAIYPVAWSQAYNELSFVLKNIKPDVILINFDINAVRYFMNFCTSLSWEKNVYAHLVIDGFPVHNDMINVIKKIKGIIVPTRASKKYLISHGVKNILYAPHGIDKKFFFSIEDKPSLRAKIGITGKANNKFIVGVFAKNEERKQLPKVLLALHYLIYNLNQKDILLYLHTQAKTDHNKGWDLEFIVNTLRLNKHVIFTAKNFLQNKGVDRISVSKNNSLSYVERLNICDLIVNIPFSGGFELCNIEAQACGIPLLTINDEGNIKEIVGESAFLIQPCVKNIWGNGAVINTINEKELAEKILFIKNNPQLQDSIKAAGLENSKKFTWQPLERALIKLLSEKQYQNVL